MTLGAGEVVTIAGAGPAGLAAAITLARAGQPVVVHEAQAEVGHRFQADLQGLENWTTEEDVLTVMQAEGLSTDFRHLPGTRGLAYDHWRNAWPVESDVPLFYLVERGPRPGSLDSALLAQAQELGVEVRFNSRLNKIPGPGVRAVGPRAADAIAVGYHFETDMDDGFWVICDDHVAPQGYAYLLVWDGYGTVKSCMFSGFKQEKLYVERTVRAFEELVGLKMRDPRPHGGVGNFRIPVQPFPAGRPVVGEQAGFQDTLWGFGMRHAMMSGVLAAQSLLEGSDYNALWRSAFGAQMETSVVNRALFSLVGNRGYRWFLRKASAAGDLRGFLRRQYGASKLRKLLLPWARRRYRSARKDRSCDHVDCNCVWCRCGGEMA